ncbi:hypothetical protein HHI36_011566 [Cryptolaemus montrouzieri]|uniref:Uncharacterized protein n=1 Tax=Cryptolaemus montrouzieri TaxID=559131 RepID=A0ABD2MMG2_9CUCU
MKEDVNQIQNKKKYFVTILLQKTPTGMENGDSYVEKLDENLSEEGKTIEPSLDKKNKQTKITKRWQRQPKRQRTHSHRDTSISDMDVPCMNTSKSVTGLKISSICYANVLYKDEYFPGKIENVNGKQYDVSTMTLSTGKSFR